MADENIERRLAPTELRGFRRCGEVILAIGAAVGIWAAIKESERSNLAIVLLLVLTPVLPITAMLRAANTISQRVLAIFVECVLVFGSCYVYLDGFLVHLSSLNTALLFQVPLAQTIVSLATLVGILTHRHFNNRTASTRR